MNHGFKIPLFGLVFLASCATQTQVQAPPQVQKGIVPLENVASSARVGEVILKEFNYIEVDIPQKITTSTPLKRSHYLGSIVLPSGSELRQVSESKFCSTIRAYRQPISGPYDIVCLYDKDHDGQFEKVSAPRIAFGAASTLKYAVPYNTEAAKKGISNADGYVRELVFMGIGNDTLRVLYREFGNNLIRADFSQELTYPITDGSIVFRDAEIDVIDIGNSQISYQVVKSGL